MTRNQIIEQLFTGKNFLECISKMEPEHLRDDLKQEVMLIVCEWPEDKVRGLWQRKELEFYVVRVILNLIRSNTSPFYKKFRTLSEQLNGFEIADDYDHEEREIREGLQDIALGEINKLYWYDAELLRLYLQLGSFRAIERETKIPYVSCFKSVKKSLAILKTKAEKKNIIKQFV